MTATTWRRARSADWRGDAKVAFPALILAVAYAFVRIPTGDLAAQVFRTDLFDRTGFATWDNFWYGGHHVPGYSVLYPPLAALTSPRVVGSVSLVVATVVFARLVRARWEHIGLATAWFLVGMVTNLVTGRLTFALGAAVALGAVAAAASRKRVLFVVLAALTPLASPIAGAFLALGGAALLVARFRDRAWRSWGITMLVVPLMALAVVQVLFPEGGSFPFPWWAFLPTVSLALVCAWVMPERERVLRTGLVLYAVACTVAFLVPTAMGANAARLGTLALGPVLVAAAGRERGRAVALLTVPLIAFQWQAPVRDLLELRSDRSVDAAYYEPLLDFLGTQTASGPFRVEVPLTSNKWEAAFVASDFPIARGWERQLDQERNGLFYGDSLDPAEYSTWLQHNGVRFVAVPQLPDRAFDPAGIGEVELIREGQAAPFLDLVWGSADWRVYEVAGDTTLVDGPGRMTELTVDSFTVDIDRVWPLLVKVRWSDHFSLDDGAPACLEESPDGWTIVRPNGVGPVTVTAGLSLGSDSHC
jgi:hypothetical protein